MSLSTLNTFFFWIFFLIVSYICNVKQLDEDVSTIGNNAKVCVKDEAKPRGSEPREITQIC